MWRTHQCIRFQDISTFLDLADNNDNDPSNRQKYPKREKYLYVSVIPNWQFYYRCVLTAVVIACNFSIWLLLQRLWQRSSHNVPVAFILHTVYFCSVESPRSPNWLLNFRFGLIIVDENNYFNFYLFIFWLGLSIFGKTFCRLRGYGFSHGFFFTYILYVFF